MDEEEILLAAQHMMRLHGARALSAATEKAETMRLQDKSDGFHAWSRIKDAIADLERKARGTVPPASE
jgi:hypothetical protein